MRALAYLCAGIVAFATALIVQVDPLQAGIIVAMFVFGHGLFRSLLERD